MIQVTIEEGTDNNSIHDGSDDNSNDEDNATGSDMDLDDSTDEN